jgi:hypothetical protein
VLPTLRRARRVAVGTSQSKPMIYNITIEFHMKLQFTVGLNIVVSLLITYLPD